MINFNLGMFHLDRIKIRIEIKSLNKCFYLQFATILKDTVDC